MVGRSRERQKGSGEGQDKRRRVRRRRDGQHLPRDAVKLRLMEEARLMG